MLLTSITPVLLWTEQRGLFYTFDHGDRKDWTRQASDRTTRREDQPGIHPPHNQARTEYPGAVARLVSADRRTALAAGRTVNPRGDRRAAASAAIAHSDSGEERLISTPAGIMAVGFAELLTDSEQDTSSEILAKTSSRVSQTPTRVSRACVEQG